MQSYPAKRTQSCPIYLILVKEGQSILKGQKIAEMGNSGTDIVKLHFEIRYQGKSVDPTKFLSAL